MGDDSDPKRSAGWTAWLLPLLVFGAALAVRLLFLSQIEAYPKFELIKNRLDDQVVFDLWAKSIVRGVPFDYASTGHEFAYWAAQRPGVFPQAPLYPYTLAAQYRFFGFHYDAVRAVQMTLGAASAVLVYLLALSFAGRGVALLCGLAVAFYGPFVFYEATFLRASVFGFVVALSLYLLIRAAGYREESPGPSSQPLGGSPRLSLLCFGVGIVLGAGVLLRPTFLLFALGGVAWLHWERRRSDSAAFEERGHSLRAVLLVLAGLVAALLPVVATNTIRAGSPAFVSSNAPYIFFIGNVHDAEGNSAGPSPSYHALKSSVPIGSVDLFSEAFRDIRNHPAGYLGLQLRKLGFFFSPDETPNNLSYTMAKKTNPWLSLAFLEYSWLFPAALLGFAVSLRSPRRFALLYLFVALYAGSTVAFYVLARLRQPVVLVLILFAGVAVAWWWRQVRAGHYLRAGSALGAIVAGSVWLGPTPTQYRPTDYAMAAAARFSLGEIREDEQQPDAARRHYARALALNPEHRQALARVLALGPPPQLGDTKQRTEAVALCQGARAAVDGEDYDEALRLLRRAARIAPELSLPRQYLANVRFLQNEPYQALAELERAVELEPENALLRENLIRLRRQLAPDG